jgi:hypothetical protein
VEENFDVVDGGEDENEEASEKAEAEDDFQKDDQQFNERVHDGLDGERSISIEQRRQ